MFCKQCGAKLADDNKICSSCGTNNEVKVEESSNPEVVANDTVEKTSEVVNQPEPKKEGKAIASLVIGIISLFIWPFGVTFIVTLIGFILGVTYKGKSGKKTAGIILNTIGMLLEIFVIIIAIGVITLTINKSKEVIKNLDGDNPIQEYLEGSNLQSFMNIMNDWNKYSNLRKGDLGKKVEITGEYRILSEKEDYVVIKNGEYYKYSSVNNKEDNYEYGSVTISNGIDGLEKVGIDSEEIDQIFNMNIGNISVDNVYITTYTPEEKVVNGIDVVDTVDERTEVWVLVDHGREGIQAINIDIENQEFSSYVKVKD